MLALTIYLATCFFWATLGVMNPAVRSKLGEMRAGFWFGLLVSSLVWPIVFGVAWTSPRVRDFFDTRFRRDFLDRDGLLEPQMPAKRCQTCSAFLELEPSTVACRSCGAACTIEKCPACFPAFDAHCKDHGTTWQDMIRCPPCRADSTSPPPVG